MSNLLAGAAQADITPPVGVDLTGYGGRTGPSTGVHDELAAGALYIADGDSDLLFVTCDLIGFHHDEVRRIREGIEETIGIPPDRVMIGCSHTHAGPATECIRFLGKPDREYLDWLPGALVKVADDARESARPATCRRGREPVRVGMNRRELRAGKVVLGTNAGGTAADYVDVLAVDTVDGVPLARLFSHAAHAVALGGDNRLISADWPGVARGAIAETTRGAVGMFLQGCCGDINCRERGWAGVAHQGEVVARAVQAAVAKADSPMHGPVAAVSVPLRLPLMAPPPVEQARATLDSLRQQLEKLPKEAGRGHRWMAEGAVEWAKGVLEEAERGRSGRMLPFEIQAFRIGELAVVALPGEVFVEYALAIDRRSPFVQTLVAGYANGNVGYIPTAAAYDEGGYEVDTAIRYYGLTMPKPQAEALIVDAAEKALGLLAGGASVG